GAAAARQHGDTFLARDRQRGGDVADFLRHDHAERLDLIDRRVGGVAAAVGSAEQHLAADFASEALGETGIAGSDGGGAHARRLPSSSWPAKAGHPRLSLMRAAKTWMAGPTTGSSPVAMAHSAMTVWDPVMSFISTIGLMGAFRPLCLPG